MIDLIQEAKKDLMAFKGQKYLFLSTTVNPGNPEVYRARNKTNHRILVVHFLLKKASNSKKIIKVLEGVVDGIVIDREIKLEGEDLTDVVEKLKLKIPTYFIKANDATTAALVSFINNAYPAFNHLAVIGAGNIGVKTTLALVEGKRAVSLVSRNVSKAEMIKSGLVCFGHFSPKLFRTKDTVKKVFTTCELIILCGPGSNIVDETHLKNVSKKLKVIIDVGGNGLSSNIIPILLKNNIQIYSFDSTPGVLAEIECAVSTTLRYKKNSKRKKGIVPVGMLGLQGDIITDFSCSPPKEIGVADGKGGFLKKFI